MRFKYLYSNKFLETPDAIWFCPNSHNGLYKLDKGSGTVRLMTRIPNEELLKSILYSSIVHYKDKIILAPCSAREVAIYDLRYNIAKKIALNKLCDLNRKIKFWGAFSCGKYAYFLGAEYPAIVRMNLDTEELVYFTDWKEWIGNRTSDYLYLSDFFIRGKYAFCSYFYEDAILKIDLQTDIMETIQLKSGVKGFYGMADDGENVWLLPSYGRRIIKWNPDSGKVLKITIPYSQADVDRPFHPPLIDGDKVYLIPLGLKEAFVVDRDKNIVTRDDALTNILETELEGKTAGYMTYNPRLVAHQKIAYINGADFGWHTYDVATHEDICEYFDLKNDERECLMAEALKQRFSGYNLVTENADFTVGTFIKCIANSEV